MLSLIWDTVKSLFFKKSLMSPSKDDKEMTNIREFCKLQCVG